MSNPETIKIYQIYFKEAIIAIGGKNIPTASKEGDIWKKTWFQQGIIQWASIHLRGFPWREQMNRTTYRVMICELLLQRTKADQVAGVFNELFQLIPDERVFLQYFSPSNMNEEKMDEIKQILLPLGFKKRFDYLKGIARLLSTKKKRSIEMQTTEELAEYPGIGRYSLNAIRCFARRERVAIVDSNVIRVYHRLFHKGNNSNLSRGDKNIWDFAQEMLPNRDYDIFNYALLDFGALICSPQNPKCNSCPFKKECRFQDNQFPCEN